MALKATEEVKTHQPGLSVRVHADCPQDFLAAVTHLVSKGTGFPAIHKDVYKRQGRIRVLTRRSWILDLTGSYPVPEDMWSMKENASATGILPSWPILS